MCRNDLSDAILNERELFDETIDEMDGVQHVKYHFDSYEYRA